MPKVSARELEACAGNPKQRCDKKADPGIQGFDNQWRCLTCHKVHVELVYQEAGNSQVNESEADNFVPAVSKKAVDRELAKRRERRPAKPRVEIPIMSLREFEAKRGARALAPEDHEDRANLERRARMSAKYGRPGGSTTLEEMAGISTRQLEETSQRLEAAGSRRDQILRKYGRAAGE